MFFSRKTLFISDCFCSVWNCICRWYICIAALMFTWWNDLCYTPTYLLRPQSQFQWDCYLHRFHVTIVGHIWDKNSYMFRVQFNGERVILYDMWNKLSLTQCHATCGFTSQARAKSAFWSKTARIGWSCRCEFTWINDHTLKMYWVKSIHPSIHHNSTLLIYGVGHKCP